jgi:hypothetical protein
MTLNIREIAEELNERARSRGIGQLQAIRKNLKLKKTQPGTKIFNTQSTFNDYAFHYGGRTELQFNIGSADGGHENLRYGVAFSFEIGRNLPSLAILVPKVKFFNDYIQLNAGDYSDMRMWHYANDRRSEDEPPVPIPSGLVRNGVFIFLGNRQSVKKIDYEKILTDFERLLPLYLYVESLGKSAPVPLPETGFNFKAGHSKRLTTAKAKLTEKELDLDLRHNLLADVLYNQLVSKCGVNQVRTEHPSGVGTQIDLVVEKSKDEYWFYEIKTALTPRACLREAIGQLLEYGFWPGAQEPKRLIVVGETPIDKEAEEYLLRLRKRFSLRVEYQCVTTAAGAKTAVKGVRSTFSGA